MRTAAAQNANNGGLLWLWASYRNYSRYFALRMDASGFLQLDLQGNHGRARTMHYPAGRVDDGAWHRVELTKRDGMLTLRIDDLPPEQLAGAPSPKVMRRRMYVGGVISKHRRVFAARHPHQPELAPAFRGCIRHFRLDDQVQRLVAHSRDLVPCAHTPGQVYIHEGGFAVYESLNANQKRKNHQKDDDNASSSIELSAYFRLVASDDAALAPESDDGDDGTRRRLLFGLFSASADAYQRARLLLSADGHSGALSLSVHLAQWRVRFEQLFDGSMTNGSASAPPPLLLCPDGRWHRVRLHADGSQLSVSLDDAQRARVPLQLPAHALQHLRALPVHLGGTTAPVALSLGTRSLHGCAKQFELDTVPMPLDAIPKKKGNQKHPNSALRKWHKLVPDGCPMV